MGDIGRKQKEIEFEPIEVPVEFPEPAPVPEPERAPAEPVSVPA